MVALLYIEKTQVAKNISRNKIILRRFLATIFSKSIYPTKIYFDLKFNRVLKAREAFFKLSSYTFLRN